MRFERLYRASMYFMLFQATLLLSLDIARDNRLAMLYPVAVAVGGVVAFLSVDRSRGFALPRDLANFLGIVSFGVALIEYSRDTAYQLLALGHFLVYLQLIKYFLQKTVEDDWYLFLLGLVEVVIGVYMSQSDEVGMLLVSWTVTTLWTFGLFHLRREASARRPRPGRSSRRPPRPRSRIPVCSGRRSSWPPWRWRP